MSPYIMNNSAKKALFAGLSTFYTYLQQEDYIAKNPVVLLRQKNRMIARAQTQHVTRRLSDIQWQFMIQTIQQYADQHSKYERHLFLLSAFYLLGVRISELSDTPLYSPIMGDFSPDKNGYGGLRLLGKA